MKAVSLTFSSLSIPYGGPINFACLLRWRALLLPVFFVLGIASSLAAQAPSCLCDFPACQTSTIDFSTGVEYPSVQLAVGTQESHWTLHNPPAGAGPIEVLTPMANWATGVGNAQWVGLPNQFPPNAPAAPPAPYTFERCIDVCSGKVTFLPFKVFASEEVVEVRLNGTVVYTSSGSTNDYQTGILVPKTRLFPNSNGQVCLEVDVNQYSAGVNMGIMVSGLAKGSLVRSDCEGSNFISGYKFHDRNGDGIQNFGDSYLPDWQINLYNDDTGLLQASALTDAYGNYQFPAIFGGDYRLYESLQSGWFPITPTNGEEDLQITKCEDLFIPFGNQFGHGTEGNICDADDPASLTTYLNITTGVDHDNSALYPAQAADDYWRVVAAPGGSNVPIMAPVPIIGTPQWLWHDYNTPNQVVGQWIGPTNTGDDPGAQAGRYTYRRCFGTCEDGLSTLDFTLFADNYVAEIRVNGNIIISYNPATMGAYTFMQKGIPVYKDIILPMGEHCLEIDVINLDSSEGHETPTGLKVEGGIIGPRLLAEGHFERSKCCPSPSIQDPSGEGGDRSLRDRNCPEEKPCHWDELLLSSQINPTGAPLLSPQVFPNPAQEEINVLLPELNEHQGQLSLYSLTGQLLLRQPFEAEDRQLVVRIDDLPPGTYLLTIVTDEDSWTQKVVKQ